MKIIQTFSCLLELTCHHIDRFNHHDIEAYLISANHNSDICLNYSIEMIFYTLLRHTRLS